MLRFLGAVFVVSGCAGIGLLSAKRHRTRIIILQEFENILQFFYGEIEFAGSDMFEILEKLSEREMYFGKFLLRVKKDIERKNGKQFYMCWQEDMHEILGYNYLTNEDITLICEVGKNLGNLDKITQLHVIDIFKERLKEICKRALQEYQGKAKISIVTGVTAGIFLAIFLY